MGEANVAVYSGSGRGCGRRGKRNAGVTAGWPAGHEAEAAAPFWGVFARYILTNPWVWVVSVANFFVYIVRIGILDWAPKYLQEAKGFDLKSAGVSLSGFELAGIFGAYAAGWLSDKVFAGRCRWRSCCC